MVLPKKGLVVVTGGDSYIDENGVVKSATNNSPVVDSFGINKIKSYFANSGFQEAQLGKNKVMFYNSDLPISTRYSAFITEFFG